MSPNISGNVTKHSGECRQTFRGNSKRHKDDLKVPTRNSVTFRDKSVRVLRPHIWNMLPVELKKDTSYGKFKTQINN